MTMSRVHVQNSSLICCLLGFALVGSAVGAAAAENPQPSPTITVNATGQTTIAPDRATIRINIQAEAMSSADAAAANARITRAVTAALRGAGIDQTDLSTESYLVQPRWRFSPPGPPRRVGYEASSTLRLEHAPLEKLGAWIDVALAAGASGIQPPLFDASHEAAARTRALTQALKQARSDAEALASAAGGSLGALEDITTAPFAPAPRPMSFMAARAAPGPEPPSTSLSPPLLDIEARVTARWRFLPGH